MKIIPAVTILEGKLVEVRDGSYHALRGKNNEIIELQDLILDLKKEYEAVYIMDIDGMEKNEPNLKVIQNNSPLAPMWVDAGPGDGMVIMDIMVAGVSKTIIGTRNMQDLDLIKEALDMSDNVVLSIDYDEKLLSPSQDISDMGMEHLCQKTTEMGIKQSIFFDFGRLNSLSSLALDKIKSMILKFDEVYVAGIVSPSDIESLEDLGVSGIIADHKYLKEWGIVGEPAEDPEDLDDDEEWDD